MFQKIMIQRLTMACGTIIYDKTHGIYMRLTVKSEYALLALLFLARNRGKGLFSVAKIGKAQNIPVKFLEQILLTMKRGGFLRSVKGQRGGYQLAKEPDQISLAEIIRLFDGALAPTDCVSQYFYGATPIEGEENMCEFFKEIRDYIARKLETTSIQDMA